MKTREILGQRSRAIRFLATALGAILIVVALPEHGSPGWAPPFWDPLDPPGDYVVKPVPISGPYEGTLVAPVPPRQAIPSPEEDYDRACTDCPKPAIAQPGPPAAAIVGGGLRDPAIEATPAPRFGSPDPPAILGKFLVDPAVDGPDPQMAVSSSYVVIPDWNSLYFYGKDGKLLSAKPDSEGLENPLYLETLFSNAQAELDASMTLPAGLSAEPCETNGGMGGPTEDCGYFLGRYYDARVIFDPYRKRFLVGALLKNGKADAQIGGGDRLARRDRALLAVSKTQDPRDGFWLYWWRAAMDQDACTVTNPGELCLGTEYEPGMGADFAGQGISSTYYLAWNASNRSSVTLGKTLENRAILHVLHADELAQGNPTWGWQFYRIEGADGGVVSVPLMTAMHYGDSAGFSYFVRPHWPSNTFGDTLNVWRLDGAVPPNLSRLEVPVKPFTGDPGLVPQMDANGGVSPTAVAYGNMLVHGAVYRNNNLHVTWSTLRINDSGECLWRDLTDPQLRCLGAIRLVRLNPSLAGINPFALVSIDRTFGKRHKNDVPGVYGHYGWPSVQVNKYGDIVIGYMRTGRHLFVEARSSVWLANESDISPSTLLQLGEYPVGSGVLHHSSGISVDPFDDTAVWVSQFYGYRDPSQSLGQFRMVVGKISGTLNPDAFVKSVELEKTTLGPGEATRLFLTVGNQGDGSAEGVHAAILLSRAPRISEDDLVLGSVEFPSIPSGGEGSAEVDLTLPRNLDGGPFHVGVVLDPDGELREYDEDNNTSAEPVQIAVEPPLPPY